MSNIIFIIDSSYSVICYLDQYLYAINEILRIQKNTDPDTLISLVTFGENTNYIHINKSLRDIHNPFSKEDINPKGMTALYDNLSSILIHMGNFFKGNKQNPIAIILTDGDDTFSKRINLNQLSLQVARSKYSGWRFIYLGVTEKSMEIGKHLGFNISIFYEVTEKCFKQIPIVVTNLINKDKNEGTNKDNMNNEESIDMRDIEESIDKMQI